MSYAESAGISVSVASRYLPEQSNPRLDYFVFAYTVVIENTGTKPAQLQTRHWIITDAMGEVEEVKGDGVIGATPYLEPGESFQYTSGCALKTQTGMMRGSYQMVRDDGERFDAKIAPFSLKAAPDIDRSLLN